VSPELTRRQVLSRSRRRRIRGASGATRLDVRGRPCRLAGQSADGYQDALAEHDAFDTARKHHGPFGIELW
jgi:hypothetical protein